VVYYNVDIPKFVTKTCKKHGQADFVLEGRGYYRCKKCRVENVARKRKSLKARLVKDFGGSCELCGYQKYQGALQFHHIEKGTKSFGLALGGMTRSYDTLLTEAKKCALLCANCHAEVEAGVTEYNGT
jgi:hypothetical protein